MNDQSGQAFMVRRPQALTDQSNDAGRCILYRPALAVAADANNAASTAAGPLAPVRLFGRMRTVWRGQAGSLRTLADAELARATLAQVVSTKANLVHCQSGPRTALGIGTG